MDALRESALEISMTFAALILAVSAGAETPPALSVDALRAVENLWSQAFVTGNAAYLDQLLEPGYVSVGASGAPHDKAAVIEAAKRYAAQHPGATAGPMAPSSTIEIKGASAIV